MIALMSHLTHRWFSVGRSRRSGSTSLNEAFSGLANSISDALKHNKIATPTMVSTTNSRGKAVSLRSKYMEQLRELHSLLDIGALTAAEYEEQRSVIVDLMRQLNRERLVYRNFIDHYFCIAFMYI